jgi:anti-anti-sigma regulatory factor
LVFFIWPIIWLEPGFWRVPGMEIKISHVTGHVPIAVFQVSGRVNLGTTEALEKAARRAYESGDRYLLLDLSGIDSLTSAGLRSIHMIYNLFGGQSTEKQAPSPYVKLLNPPPEILTVLQIAGFTRFFETFTDQRSALASFV